FYLDIKGVGGSHHQTSGDIHGLIAVVIFCSAVIEVYDATRCGTGGLIDRDDVSQGDVDGCGGCVALSQNLVGSQSDCNECYGDNNDLLFHNSIYFFFLW